MTSFSRLALAAAAAFALLVPASLAKPAKPIAPPVQPWPQAHSDLAADPSVVFGTLPNGMRYAIKHNETPRGSVSLRLRIDAGSLMERDEEQGLAHMLEHMAFRGSAHVADGDTVKKLQSLGLSFGADTNAFTAATETVYSFDMPKNDAQSVDTSLMLLREIAGELTISQAALDTERNVVMAEARLHDVPGAHLRKDDFAYLYGARAASALLPIGLEPVIANASPALIRGFYEAWYRPERATLIIVGDIDPATLAAKIRARFSDWKAKVPPRKAFPYGVLKASPPPVHLFGEQGSPMFVTFNWIRPFDPTPDGKARETRDLIRFLAMGVLNQRLAALSHGENPPFTAASASHDHIGTIADVSELVVNYRSGQWADGVKAAERAWRDIVAHGVCQSEVDQIVAQSDTFFQTQVAASDTTQSSQLVNLLLRSVDEKEVFTSPQSDLAMFRQIVKGLDAKKISEALKDLFGGKPPYIFLAGASWPPGAEASVRDAVAQADATPLAARSCDVAPPWPYANFGTPGHVASTTAVDDLGVTFVRFDNGVTLTVKPTQFHIGQVLVDVRLGEGRLALPADHAVPVWGLSSFVPGGLRQYSIDNLQKFLADRLWNASLTVDDDDFTLRGITRAADLDVQMQVLAAYITDPGWSSVAFDQTRTSYAGNYDGVMASPASLLGREIYGRLHAADPRWRAPTLDEIKGASLDDAKAILAPSLAKAPIDIVMVGDVTVEQAIAAVASTFGALPSRGKAPDAPDGDEHFPKPTPEPDVVVHHGAANQAVALMVYPTTGFFKAPREQRVLRVLAEIFSTRLLDELRTREGITYTPDAGTRSSIVTSDYGFFYAYAQIPPDKIANFYQEADTVASDLAAKPVTQDELDRARGPHVEDILKQRQTNEYWAGLLAGAEQDRRRLDVMRTTIPDLQGVTTGDIQDAARKWLNRGKAYRMVVVPPGFTPPKLNP